MAEYERNYYVISDDNCKFPSMTYEQIIAAIAEATGETPTHVDDAFISKIRELNRNNNLRFWVGTTAEYNALANAGQIESNCMYIITDDAFGDDVTTELNSLRSAITNLRSTVTTLNNVTEWTDIISDGRTVGEYKKIGKTAFIRLYCLINGRSGTGTRSYDILIPEGVLNSEADYTTFAVFALTNDLQDTLAPCRGFLITQGAHTHLKIYDIPVTENDLYLRGSVCVPLD